MKKHLAIVLAVLMILTLLPGAAMANEINTPQNGICNVVSTVAGHSYETAQKASAKTKKTKAVINVKKAKFYVNTATVKKKSQKLSIGASVNSKGKLSYKLVKYGKNNAKKYLKLNKKTGKIIVKKGTPKGTYKIKVKISAKATSKFKAAGKAVTIKICVKDAPAMVTTINAYVKTNCINVAWSKALGANKYCLYRKTEGGKWKIIKETDSNFYIDKDLVNGTTYYYYVTAMNKAGSSKASKTVKAVAQIKQQEKETSGGEKETQDVPSSGGEGETNDDSGGDGDSGDCSAPRYTSAKSDPDNSSKTISANGNTVSVPANANIIVAPGEAAIMVEMLGENNTGHDILFGTSESVLNNQITTTVFPDLAITDSDGNSVQQLWNEDGSSPMTDECFNLLLQNAENVDVVFYIDGQNSFTDEQLCKLNEADIAVVCLYKMNTPENIKKNAQIIGSILGYHPKSATSKEGIDSRSTTKNGMAKKYCAWIDNIIAQFSNSHFTTVTDLGGYGSSVFLEDGGKETADAINNSNGQYTVLADYWDDTAQINLNYDGNQTVIGTGAAGATAGYYKSPLNYFMQIAGVVNTAAAQVDYWPSFKNINKIWYLNQYAYGDIVIDGSYGEYIPGYGGAGEYEEHSGAILSQISNDSIYNYITANLGTSNFQKVVAANTVIAANLTNAITFTQNGIPELEAASTIKGAYDIVINPCGAGNWIKGSVETPLESFWIADTFGTATVSTTCYDATRNFYNTFYAHADNGGSTISDEDFDNLYNNYITTAATYKNY